MVVRDNLNPGYPEDFIKKLRRNTYQGVGELYQLVAADRNSCGSALA